MSKTPLAIHASPANTADRKVSDMEICLHFHNLILNILHHFFKHVFIYAFDLNLLVACLLSLGREQRFHLDFMWGHLFPIFVITFF